MTSSTETDHKFMQIALEAARLGYEEGGVPVGAALVENGKLIATGHNQRVQKGDPIAHGEMDCFRKAGRRPHYRNTTLYTTLSPCMMCSGTILQFGVPRVVVGETSNFEGNLSFLREHGVEVILLDDPGCIQLMEQFIKDNPSLWNEDIAEREHV